jgi:cell wall-associated NlpC family hydrolase
MNIESYLLSRFPNEAGGFLLSDDSFIPIENTATDKRNCYEFDESVLWDYNSIVAIVHSHTHTPKHSIDPRAPSKADLETLFALDVEGLIYHCDGENVGNPVLVNSTSMEPLEGRRFVHNVYDCWELYRDYLISNGRYVDNVARHPDWFMRGESIFMDNYERLGFIEVDKPEPGDMILMRIEAKNPNHCGAYLGQNKLLHHLPGRLSGVDSYAKYRNRITHILRLQ